MRSLVIQGVHQGEPCNRSVRTSKGLFKKGADNTLLKGSPGLIKPQESSVSLRLQLFPSPASTIFYADVQVLTAGHRQRTPTNDSPPQPAHQHGSLTAALSGGQCYVTVTSRIPTATPCVAPVEYNEAAWPAFIDAKSGRAVGTVSSSTDR